MARAPIPFSQWQVKASEFPNLGAAEQWRQQNGVEVEGLPPPAMSRAMTDPRQMTAPLSSAIIDQAPQEQPNMEETDTTVGALPGGAMRGLMDLAREQQSYLGKRQTAKTERFEQGQKEIAQLYGGPSLSQTLFALSRALLSPRPYGGFAGTMYNVNNALSGISDQARSSEQKRAEALMQLRSSYADDMDEAELASMEARRKLLEAQAEQERAAAKAGETKYDINPLTGSYQQRPGTGGNVGVLTPEQVLVARQDPRNKGKSFYTTDGRLGVF